MISGNSVVVVSQGRDLFPIKGFSLSKDGYSEMRRRIAPLGFRPHRYWVVCDLPIKEGWIVRIAMNLRDTVDYDGLVQTIIESRGSIVKTSFIARPDYYLRPKMARVLSILFPYSLGVEMDCGSIRRVMLSSPFLGSGSDGVSEITVSIPEMVLTLQDL